MRYAFALTTMMMMAAAGATAQTSTPKPAPKPAAPATSSSASKPAAANRLLNPAAMNAKAPETFRARFDTSKGAFVIEVHRDWAPIGADRFYNLVRNGFYNDARFFRALTGFMVQ